MILRDSLTQLLDGDSAAADRVLAWLRSVSLVSLLHDLGWAAEQEDGVIRVWRP